MTSRDRILATFRDLTLAEGSLPSLDTLARAAGLSKGGLLHHFPSRLALVTALVERAVTELDDALRAAADERRVAETWLRLSVPDAGDLELYRAMAVMARVLMTDASALPASLHGSIAQWESLIAAEVGDERRARVIRLVGDGLFFTALTGTPPTSRELDELVADLCGAAR